MNTSHSLPHLSLELSTQLRNAGFTQKTGWGCFAYNSVGHLCVCTRYPQKENGEYSEAEKDLIYCPTFEDILDELLQNFATTISRKGLISFSTEEDGSIICYTYHPLLRNIQIMGLRTQKPQHACILLVLMPGNETRPKDVQKGRILSGVPKLEKNNSFNMKKILAALIFTGSILPLAAFASVDCSIDPSGCQSSNGSPMLVMEPWGLTVSQSQSLIFKDGESITLKDGSVFTCPFWYPAGCFDLRSFYDK